jgi:hypothetical protein
MNRNREGEIEKVLICGPFRIAPSLHASCHEDWRCDNSMSARAQLSRTTEKSQQSCEAVCLRHGTARRTSSRRERFTPTVSSCTSVQCIYSMALHPSFTTLPALRRGAALVGRKKDPAKWGWIRRGKTGSLIRGLLVERARLAQPPLPNLVITARRHTLGNKIPLFAVLHDSTCEKLVLFVSLCMSMYIVKHTSSLVHFR